jgi:hypothetical protein
MDKRDAYEIVQTYNMTLLRLVEATEYKTNMEIVVLQIFCFQVLK